MKKMDREEWAELSALLDEALDLDAGRRESWLRETASTHAALGERLRLLLELGEAAESDEFLRPLDFSAILNTEANPGQPAVPDWKPDRQIGAYRLVRELGQGGMGHVWLAERIDGRFERQVALKFPYAGLHRRLLSERLARERDILARLEHPNIARLYDADVTELDQPFLVLEYVDGVPINDYCDQRRLTVRERLVLFLQVLNATGYAHSHLVIHCDIKPSNILIAADGVARLLDFGISKLMSEGGARESALTQLSGRVLTPDYASPEQISGQPVTTISDVYSLGVVLYELLTGSRPYRLKRESRVSLEEAIVAADVIAPSRTRFSNQLAEQRGTSVRALSRALRGDLNAIILKALHRDPALRYASASALAQDLKHWLDGEVVEAQPPSAWYRLRKLASRNRVAFGAAIAIVLALITGAALAGWQAKAAMAQATRLQATKRFLVDVFNANSVEQSDPLKAQNMTARELLDRAAARLDSGPQPSAEETEELLSVLGDLYREFGLDDKSAALELRRAALLKQMVGANDVRYATALVEYAKNVYDTDDWKKASVPLQTAERILDSHHDDSSYTRGQLLGAMAEYFRGVDRQRSREYVERGIAFEKHYFPNSLQLIEDLRLAALIDSETGHNERAIPRLQEALAIQEQSGAYDIFLIRPLVSLAEAQSDVPGNPVAEANFRRGLTISQRINGEAAVDTIQTRRRLGEFLRAAGRLQESEDMLTTAEVNAVTLLGEQESFHLPTIRNELAQTEYELGNYAVAVDLNRRALEVRERSRAGNRQHSVMLSTHALLMIGMGHAPASESVMTRAIEGFTKSEVPLESTMAPLIQSSMYSAIGKHVEALHALDRYDLGPEPSQSTLKVHVEVRRAAVYADMDEIEKAQRILEAQMQAVRALPPVPSSHLLEAQIQLQLGRLLLRQQLVGAAQPLLDAALQTRLAHLSPHSPLVADNEVALAECLLQQGETAQAKMLFNSAAVIQKFNVELGDQYRQPFRHLQTLLGSSKATRTTRDKI